MGALPPTYVRVVFTVRTASLQAYGLKNRRPAIFNAERGWWVGNQSISQSMSPEEWWCLRWLLSVLNNCFLLRHQLAGRERERERKKKHKKYQAPNDHVINYRDNFQTGRTSNPLGYGLTYTHYSNQKQTHHLHQKPNTVRDGNRLGRKDKRHGEFRKGQHLF